MLKTIDGIEVDIMWDRMIPDVYNIRLAKGEDYYMPTNLIMILEIKNTYSWFLVMKIMLAKAGVNLNRIE